MRVNCFCFLLMAGCGADTFVSGSPLDGAAPDGVAEASADGGGLQVKDIKELAFWLEPANLVQSNQKISQWKDSTPNMNDAALPPNTTLSPPTYVPSCLNGHPCAKFQNSAFLAMAEKPSLQWGLDDIYVAVVAQFDNDPNGNADPVGTLFARAGVLSTSTVMLLTGNIPGMSPKAGAAITLDPNQAAATLNAGLRGKPHLFAFHRAGVELTLRVDGMIAGTSKGTAPVNTTPPNTQIRISALDMNQARLNGMIAEVIAERAKSIPAAHISAIEDYFRRKYNVM